MATLLHSNIAVGRLVLGMPIFFQWPPATVSLFCPGSVALLYVLRAAGMHRYMQATACFEILSVSCVCVGAVDLLWP